MTKTLENFIKKLKKLDDYYILREESEYLLVGTEIIIKEHKEVHTTFSTYTSNVDRKVPVFFMIIIGESQAQHKIFVKNDLPVLEYHANMKDVKVTLDDFVAMWI